MTGPATSSNGPVGGRRLYRDPGNGMIFGVCAGLADYFGFDVAITRVLVVLGLVVFFPTILLAYLVLAVLLPKKPKEDVSSDDPLQRQVRSEPHATLSALRHRFRELDVRLQRLEKYVTSERFRLDREFESLKD